MAGRNGILVRHWHAMHWWYCGYGHNGAGGEHSDWKCGLQMILTHLIFFAFLPGASVPSVLYGDDQVRFASLRQVVGFTDARAVVRYAAERQESAIVEKQ